MAGKRALVLTNALKIFAGSEMVALEVAETLHDMGYDVDIVCNVSHDRVLRSTYKELKVTTDWPGIRLANYSIVWAQHSMLGLLVPQIQEAGFEGLLLSAHLSSRGAVERAGLIAAAACNARVVVNSRETMDRMNEFGVPAAVMCNFKNASHDRFYRADHSASPQLTRILAISNHMPPEALEAFDLIRKRGVKVEQVGKGASPRRITPSDIQNADAVFTIGKSAQYAILSGTPVYCYDRFAGPGWLTTENIQRAEDFNFSGRGYEGKKTAEQIASEVFDGYAQVVRETMDFHRVYAARYSLGNFLRSQLEQREEPDWSGADMMGIAATCAEATSFLINKHQRRDERRVKSPIQYIREKMVLLK